ncbi:MAG: hypothetical protein J6P54_06135 [Bacteroidales bacterium]|nr:hypothetical protein [Bacteroidales bacterium]
MSRGKTTCKMLKEVRRKIADANDIPLEERECTHKGDCAGTCPYCEAEVRYLERELSKRKSLGKAVAVAGIALSAVAMASCATSEPVSTTFDKNTKTPEEEIPWDDCTMGEVVRVRKHHSKERVLKAKKATKMQKCDTYQMQGIVPKSNSSSTAFLDTVVVEYEFPEYAVGDVAYYLVVNDSIWHFPSSQGSLRTYMRKQLKKDPELRKWVRKKTKELLRDESKEPVFMLEFGETGDVFGLLMDINREEGQEYEKLLRIFVKMPKWELNPGAEKPEYHVRQKVPVEVLR